MVGALLVCMSSYHHTGVCGGGITSLHVHLSSYGSVWWGHYLYVCPVTIIRECVVAALLVCMSSYHHTGGCGGGHYFYACPVIIIRQCVVEALLVCMSSYHHTGVCGGGINCMYVQLYRSVW